MLFQVGVGGERAAGADRAFKRSFRHIPHQIVHVWVDGCFAGNDGGGGVAMFT